MSVLLPYFKFYPGEWLAGDIQGESKAVRGVFADIISLYWNKDCEYSLHRLRKRLPGCEDEINALIDSELIRVDKDGYVQISFLNDQSQTIEKAAINSRENGKKGGRPPKEEKPKITQNNPAGFSGYVKQEPEKPNLKEEEEEDKKKKNIIINSNDVNENQNPEKSETQNQKTPEINSFGHVKTLDEMQVILLDPSTWKDSFCMSAGIEKKDADFYISEFVKECRGQGTNHTNVNEAKKHCLNWTRKKIAQGLVNNSQNHLHLGTDANKPKTTQQPLSAAARFTLKKREHEQQLRQQQQQQHKEI